MQVKVGSFTKPTGAAPVSQDVTHNLGAEPKAIIFWSAAKTAETVSAEYEFGLGFAVGLDVNNDFRAIGASSKDGGGNSFVQCASQNKAVLVKSSGGGFKALADLTAWDSSIFTLNWTTNDSSAYIIHYMIVGGDDVECKIKEWTGPTVTGNFTVSSLGLLTGDKVPDLVLHMGIAFTSHPINIATLTAGLGVMDKNGNQWAMNVGSKNVASPTVAGRQQLTNKCIHFKDPPGTSVLAIANFVSMNQNSFTMNFTTAAGGRKFFSLVFKFTGLARGKVGSFTKPTGAAPVSQDVNANIIPKGVFLAGYQNITSALYIAHNRLGVGAGDGTNEGCSAFSDTNALATASADGLSKTTKAFAKINNDTQTIDAEADLTLDTGKFVLAWTTNDAVATQICYMVLGEAILVSVEEAPAVAELVIAGRMLRVVESLGITEVARIFNDVFLTEAVAIVEQIRARVKTLIVESTTIADAVRPIKKVLESLGITELFSFIKRLPSRSEAPRVKDRVTVRKKIASGTTAKPDEYYIVSPHDEYYVVHGTKKE